MAKILQIPLLLFLSIVSVPRYDAIGLVTAET